MRKWSGTPFHAWAAIAEAYPDAILINTPRIDQAMQFANKFCVRLGFDLFRMRTITKLYAWHLARQLRRARADVLVSVGATHKVSDLDWAGRILHVSDALYATVLDNYGKYARLSDGTKRRGDAIQRRALARIDTVFLSSKWAADDAARHYPEFASKMQHAPFGANIYDPGPERLPKSALKLLFVGSDWQRKGGDRVVAITRLLRQSHPDCVLDVVGSNPGIASEPGLHVHGRLDKDDPVDAATLDRLYREAAFLIVLSETEAFGIVFCEAAAYSVPVIATNAGGIPTIVEDQRTGLLFPVNAEPQDIARAIESLWSDRPRYEAFAVAARARFESVLNWGAWARTIGDAAKRAMSAVSPGNV
ncbi:glycosyltransferase family 4 protein [Sphingomonas antarctica]|uniref:glycosyltransferase family 4 protein n=1 Tax=Sphingomonas antarctica TaxID=2040274 RepID=UPI0039EC9B44